MRKIMQFIVYGTEMMQLNNKELYHDQPIIFMLFLLSLCERKSHNSICHAIRRYLLYY